MSLRLVGKEGQPDTRLMDWHKDLGERIARGEVTGILCLEEGPAVRDFSAAAAER